MVRAIFVGSAGEGGKATLRCRSIAAAVVSAAAKLFFFFFFSHKITILWRPNLTFRTCHTFEKPAAVYFVVRMVLSCLIVLILEEAAKQTCACAHHVRAIALLRAIGALPQRQSLALQQ